MVCERRSDVQFSRLPIAGKQRSAGVRPHVPRCRTRARVPPPGPGVRLRAPRPCRWRIVTPVYPGRHKLAFSWVKCAKTYDARAEKSDSAIVAGKPTNKAERTAAERISLMLGGKPASTRAGFSRAKNLQDLPVQQVTKMESHHQSQDRQNARPRRAARAIRRCQRCDRIKMLFAAVQRSAIGRFCCKSRGKKKKPA